MNDIEKRARELLAGSCSGQIQFSQPRPNVGDRFSVPAHIAIEAIIAALTPPEVDMANPISAPDGFVLVPVETLFDLVEDAESYVRSSEFRPSRLVHKLRSVHEAKKLLAARPEVP